MKTRVGRTLNSLLRPLGLQVSRKGQFGLEMVRRKWIPTWYERLKHMKSLGFSPQVVFDCGAFIGEWTLQASRIFASAQFVLIEPNKMITDQTRARVAEIRPEVILLEVAVGDARKSAHLNVWADEQVPMDGSSLLGHAHGDPASKIEIEVLPLDVISETYGLRPDLLKLDLQGSELSALKGARDVLTKVELVIVEFGCLEAYVERATPRDLMDMMYENDFRLYDIVDAIYRPYDGTLAGGDFFFIKRDHPLSRYKEYR